MYNAIDETADAAAHRTDLPFAMLALLPTDIAALAPPTVVVATATGRVGSHVVSELQRKDCRVRAICRDVSKLPEELRAEAIQADLTQSQSSLRAAFAEAGLEHGWRLFMAAPAGKTMALMEKNLMYAAIDGGATYTVKLSTAEPVLRAAYRAKIGPAAAHLQVEAALKRANIEWSVLRPTLFYQMLLDGRLGLADGWLADGADSDAALPHVLGGCPIAMVDARDVAAAAAALLATDDPSAWHRRTLDCTGPEAALIDSVPAALGATDRTVQALDDSQLDAYVKQAYPPAAFPTFRAYYEILRRECATTTGHVEEACGIKPRSLEDFVRDSAEAFGGQR